VILLGGKKREGKGFWVDPTGMTFSVFLILSLSSDRFPADSAVFTDIRPDMSIVSCTAYNLKPRELNFKISGARRSTCYLGKSQSGATLTAIKDFWSSALCRQVFNRSRSNRSC
jgi:hypothetical protein